MSDRKLTVVQVLPALQSGGVERGTLEVGKYLTDHGHRSIVISAGGRMVEQLQREGSEHVQWDIGKKSLWTIRLIPRLRRFLIENKVDILHVRSRMPAWVCYLAWKSMNPKTRPHLVTTVHGMYSTNPYSAVMTRGEAVIAVSRTIETYIYRHYPATDQRRVVVIPRGVDRAVYAYGYQPTEDWLRRWQQDYPALQGKYILLLPGRITRLKGHEDFLHLLAQLRARNLPVHGLIVGGAEPGKQAYLDELYDLSRNLGLEADVTFTGQRHDLREIMAVSTMVLSLSNQPESFGRTVLEALSLGVPVLGYDHGGVGEQLEALLPEGRIELGNLSALTERISQWLEKPPAIVAEHDFTLDQMLASTLTVYSRLASQQELTH